MRIGSKLTIRNDGLLSMADWVIDTELFDFDRKPDQFIIRGISIEFVTGTGRIRDVF